LIDEYRLLIHTAVLGAGERIFLAPHTIEPMSTTVFSGGAVAHVLRRIPDGASTTIAEQTDTSCVVRQEIGRSVISQAAVSGTSSTLSVTADRLCLVNDKRPLPLAAVDGDSVARRQNMGSTRHDGDNWDLESSVGATATMSAAARAIATREDRSLFDDPFAEPLVRAVGIDFLTRLASGELPPDDLVEPTWIYVGRIRGKFYDEFFLDATNAGIAQVVILASGLDSRAYRLPWPPGTVVYEVDKPQVAEFKTRTLAELGAVPTADRRVAEADLRDDWPTALATAGFDRGQPTAWSAEGLLGYLPPQAQDRLLDTITELSAPGSRVATESKPNPLPGQEEQTRDGLHRMSERWRAHGFAPDMAGARYDGQRNEAAPYLADLGWALNESSVRDLFSANNLWPLADDMRMGDVLYVSGTLNKTTK
jgi:methyltransferase (TIGR00027 family)